MDICVGAIAYVLAERYFFAKVIVKTVAATAVEKYSQPAAGLRRDSILEDVSFLTPGALAKGIGSAMSRGHHPSSNHDRRQQHPTILARSL
jgi:hypothetical protein